MPKLDVFSELDDDFDLEFSVKGTSAKLRTPVTVPADNLTSLLLRVHVRYSNPDTRGRFVTVYSMKYVKYVFLMF